MLADLSHRRLLYVTVGSFFCGYFTLRLVTSRSLGFLVPRRIRQFHQTHESPVPRFGGLAICVSALISISLAVRAGLLPVERSNAVGLAFGMLALFAIGFVDDLRPLGAKYKLLLQVVASTISVVLGLRMLSFTVPFVGDIITNPWMGGMVTVVWLVGCTNVINLMDGIDGLAGGISLMVLGLILFVAQSTGDAMGALVAAALLGSVGAFLWLNLPPARVYLGDGGAYLLGFSLGALSIQASHKGVMQLAFFAPMLAMALPFFDVVAVIIRRCLSGFPILRADKGHIHHRLQSQGFSRLTTLLILYAVSAIFLLSGLALVWAKDEILPFAWATFAVGGLLFLHLLVRKTSTGRLRDLFGRAAATRTEVQNAVLLSNWLKLQAERTGSANQLWGDYCFVLSNLGMVSVVIETAHGDLSWTNPSAANSSQPADLSDRFRIHGAYQDTMFMVLSGSSRKTPSRLFFLLAELAADAFQSAFVLLQERTNSTDDFFILAAGNDPAAGAITSSTAV